MGARLKSRWTSGHQATRGFITTQLIIRLIDLTKMMMTWKLLFMNCGFYAATEKTRGNPNLVIGLTRPWSFLSNIANVTWLKEIKAGVATMRNGTQCHCHKNFSAEQCLEVSLASGTYFSRLTIVWRISMSINASWMRKPCWTSLSNDTVRRMRHEKTIKAQKFCRLCLDTLEPRP